MTDDPILAGARDAGAPMEGHFIPSALRSPVFVYHQKFEFALPALAAARRQSIEEPGLVDRLSPTEAFLESLSP